MQDQKLAAHLSDLANLFRQVADGIDGLYDVLAHSTESSVPVTAEQAAPAPAPGGTMTLEQFNAKVVSLIRDNPNRGPAAKALLTRYAPNGGGAPAVDPAQYQNFIAELEQAQ